MFDDYGKTVFIDREIKLRSELSYFIADVDFHKLRLFLLSMAWRASISTREEFDRVNLGSYKSRLHDLFLKEKMGTTDYLLDDYQFVVTKFDSGRLPVDVVNKNIQIPHCQKICGINVIVFYLPKGFKIFLKLDKRRFPESLQKLANNNVDGLIIARLGDYAKSLEFKAMLNTI